MRRMGEFRKSSAISRSFALVRRERRRKSHFIESGLLAGECEKSEGVGGNGGGEGEEKGRTEAGKAGWNRNKIVAINNTAKLY